ncbi:MAG: hypothetical protein AAGF11_54825 [Myxococcota bacterium]
MNRHIIDESGVWLDGLSGDDAEKVIRDFLDRLDTARDRGERIARTRSDLYNATVAEGIEFFQLLFEDESPIRLGIDLRQRLRIAIDRAYIWDDHADLIERVQEFDVIVNDKRVFAPSVAFAHACRSRRHAVGCMNFRSSGRCGTERVQVGEYEHELHFIIDESTHTQLFRDAVEIENMDESSFRMNAGSAFPRLLWADGVWAGLDSFRRPYREHRHMLVKHLGVLNDYCVEIFEELASTHPEEIGARLDALGVEASDENGRTKRNKDAKKARTRAFQGRDFVFWWHTKLLRHVDRIHFLWRAQDKDIIIGIFTDHCYIPD